MQTQVSLILYLEQIVLCFISSSGVLTFITAPDYETQGDTDADNSYEINVIVSTSLSVTRY